MTRGEGAKHRKVRGAGELTRARPDENLPLGYIWLLLMKDRKGS